MRLMMALSTLVIIAVAVLWLAMRPVEQAPLPVVGTASGEPESAEPLAAEPPVADPGADEPAVDAPADDDGEAAPTAAPSMGLAEPTRYRLIAPRATPVPRPIQGIPSPKVIPPADPPPTKVAVHNAIRSAKPLVTDCYTQALAHSPDLAGTLKVSFTVTPDEQGVGRIREAEVLDEGLRQPFLEMCVLEALGSAEYPTPAGVEGELKVTYPFVLRPRD